MTRTIDETTQPTRNEIEPGEITRTAQPTRNETAQITLRTPGPIGKDSPTVGLHEGITEDEYRSWPALNQSLLKLGVPGKGSMLHLRAEMVSPTRSTRAMDIGTALHALVLQPDRFETMVFTAPETRSRRSKADKEFWSELEEEAGQRVILKTTEWDTVRRMADSLMSHPISGPMLTGNDGRSEVSAVWDEPGTRMRCKTRIDRIVPGAFSIDIKKTTDASEGSFMASIRKYGYHCQAAWNEIGFEAVTGAKSPFTLAAVEENYPFAVHCYCPSDRAVELGRVQLMASLSRYMRAIREDSWPSYNENKLTAFDMPEYEYALWGVGSRYQ